MDKLKNEIDAARKDIRTDDYSISIGEWISKYERNEIDIHPEFQRFYRWNSSQKTKLIESILLGIPIPPIFVSQRNDGVWDIVDGLQRLSTIFEFVGILKNENQDILDSLILEEAKYLPSLKGKYWKHESEDVNQFSEEQRLLFRTAKMSVSIILRESDSKAKFELFQRLNTGGSSLTEQEVRNCILVMINRDIYVWLNKLSQRESFKECVSLSDGAIDERFDMELALRFILLATIDLSEIRKVQDVHVFLTEKMVLFAESSPDLDKIEDSFNNTFDCLQRVLNSNSFKRFSSEKDKFLGGFILSSYEVVAIGMGYSFLTGKSIPDDDTILRRIKQLWNNEIYKQWSGSGITATRRLPHLIPLGRSLFQP